MKRRANLIKRKNPLVAARAAAYLAARGRLTLTAISTMEVVYGLRRKGDGAQKSEEVDADAVLPVDRQCSTIA